MTLTEVMIANPRTSIILISALATLVSSLLMKWFTNQEHLKSLKSRQKEIQKELKEHRKNGNISEMEKLNKEMMELSLQLMKSSFSFKQILVTIIPFLILFSWIRGIYGGENGVLSTWFWWYLGTALILGSVYRKIFKMA